MPCAYINNSLMHTCVNSSIKMCIFILVCLSLTYNPKKAKYFIIQNQGRDIYAQNIRMCEHATVGTQACSKEGNKWRPSRKNIFPFFLQEKDSWFPETQNCIQFWVPSKRQTYITWSEFDRRPLVWSGNCSICTVKRDWGYCSCSAWKKKCFFGGFRET